MKPERRIYAGNKAMFTVTTDLDNRSGVQAAIDTLIAARDAIAAEGVPVEDQSFEIESEDEYGSIYYTVKVSGMRDATAKEKKADNDKTRREHLAWKKRLEDQLADVNKRLGDE